MMRILAFVAALAVAGTASSYADETIKSGHVLGNSTSAERKPTDTSLLGVMQQPGSGLGSGVATAIAQPVTGSGGLVGSVSPTITGAGSSLWAYSNIGASATGAGSWITTWDGPGAYPALNPLQIISPNASRALSLYSRQSDYASGGIYSPETLSTFAVMDVAPPPAFVGTWARYSEYDQSWTGNPNILGDEEDVYTHTPSYLAGWSSDPFTYNGLISSGTPSYSGTTLTISGITVLTSRPPTTGMYVDIQNITGTSGVSPNGFYPVASVTGSGTGPYTLTFSIPGVTGTPTGTAGVVFTGHSSTYRLACGSGKTSPNNCSTALDIVNNNAPFEAGIVVASGSLDLSSPSVVSATHAAGVVTLNFATAPAWAVAGNPITVSGATSDTTINGTFIIIGGSATSVYYSVAGSGSPVGTIAVGRSSAPAFSMPEQYGLTWYGSAYTPFASVYEQQSGGFAVLHVSMPQTGGSVSFEFSGSPQLQLNSTTLYPTFNNSFSLGATSNNFAKVYSSIYYSGSTSGVSCSGSPTASFAATGGIVTHC